MNTQKKVRTRRPIRRNPSRARQVDLTVSGRGTARTLTVQVWDHDGELADSGEGRLDAMWPLFNPRNARVLNEGARNIVYDFDLAPGDTITLHVTVAGQPRAIREWSVASDRSVRLRANAARDR
jgi:hypothetical protein